MSRSRSVRKPGEDHAARRGRGRGPAPRAPPAARLRPRSRTATSGSRSRSRAAASIKVAWSLWSVRAATLPTTGRARGHAEGRERLAPPGRPARDRARPRTRGARARREGRRRAGARRDRAAHRDHAVARPVLDARGQPRAERKSTRRVAMTRALERRAGAPRGPPTRRGDRGAAPRRAGSSRKAASQGQDPAGAEVAPEAGRAHVATPAAAARGPKLASRPAGHGHLVASRGHAQGREQHLVLTAAPGAGGVHVEHPQRAARRARELVELGELGVACSRS